MGLWKWAQSFPARLPSLTEESLRRMAENPSYRAPHANEVLRLTRFIPPIIPSPERERLDAVLADPDDDAARLRFADWCDSIQDPRGAMIRKQIHEASPMVGSDCPPILLPWSPRDLVYRRGFVEGMSLSGRAFVSIGAELFRLIPLREVRLVAVQPFITELADCEHLRRLRSLNLRGNCIGDVEMGILLASPHVQRLRCLDLSQNLLSDAILGCLTPNLLPNVDRINLGGNRFAEAGLEILRKSWGNRALL